MAASSAAGQKFPEGRHVLRLGDSFFSRSSHGQSYHTMRYDFKPASVGDCKETYVEVAENQEVTVTVPKLDDTGEVKNATVFKGPRKPYQKECLLIYDRETGEFVLEHLGYNIQLKKTRGEVTEEVLQNIRETRKKIIHAAGTGSSTDASFTPAEGSGTAGRTDEPVTDADAELMSESDGSCSDSDSSDEDDAGADEGQPDTALNGGDMEFSEDELAKTLEAELTSSQDAHGEPSSRDNGTGLTNGNNFESLQRHVPPPSSSRLHEDLLLSESSDDD